MKILMLVCLLMGGWTQAVRASDAEQQLLKTMTAIQNLQLNEAIQAATQLVQAYPHYKAAQLLKANLLALKSGQPLLSLPVDKNHQLQSFASEISLRWHFNQNLNQSVLNIEDAVISNAHKGYLVMINTQLHRLFLFKQTEIGLEEVDNFYVSIGQKGSGKNQQGDLKTPTGVYWINQWKPDNTLPDLYGAGALTLNYPNAWDKLNGKTGYGIWLHGTPSDTYTRVPLASKGCVVLTNDAVQRLHQKYQLGKHTPVMIFNEMPQLSSAKKSSIKSQLMAALQFKSTSIDWSTLIILPYPAEKGLFYITYRTLKGEQKEDYWHEKSGVWQSVVSNTLFTAPLDHETYARADAQ